jgi:iron-sulfur cluster assembly accessory protein
MDSVATTEIVVSLTANAAAEAKTLLDKEADGGKKGLRVFVEAGGCSGMQYGMVFDERRESDLCSLFSGVPVFVDPISADYLRGTVVDFNDSLTGGGFKISNPQARQSCGCGKSFEA